MLAFDNLWVYSKRATTSDPNQKSASTTDSILSEKYRYWLKKITNRSAPDHAMLTQERTLINGVSGKLLAGQITVLTGSSGSGKSVLLRVLAGLLPMSSGEVRLQGQRHSNSPSHVSTLESIHEIAPTEWRSRVSLLAQHPQLLEGRVIDNLQLPYRLQAHQHRKFDIDWHVEQLNHLERRTDFLYQEATHLSGGERQLVNTLRLLQLNPQVLLLDEPTAALDSDTSAQLVRLLIGWLRADPHRTLLWVTHDNQDIMPLADRHWHMQAGILSDIS
ncbi:ATP-binding cassette domain-containing protein [Psychrobacter sp. JB385]|uniref:ABC transporter ATP-binding protein n=1 Tax=Psychrobacter sp. JB385 TaxID=1434841 RepID=UPI000B35B2C2|nr:ATP-binding cassette domain-containing protein [Psychrobacter sp. JB385]